MRRKAYCFCSYFFLCPFLLHQNVLFYLFIISMWRAFLSHSFREGPLEKNFHSFFHLRISSSLHYQRIFLLVLDSWLPFFSFSIWNTLWHFFLVFMVYDEKCTVTQIFFLLYVRCHFLRAVFKNFFFVTSFQKFD